GVIYAHGSRFGGHSMFIKDRKLHYVYNFLGIKPEQVLVSEESAPGKHVLGMAFARGGTASRSEKPSCLSTTTSSPKRRGRRRPASSRCAETASASASTVRIA